MTNLTVANWNIGGAKFLQLPPAERKLFQQQLNAELDAFWEDAIGESDNPAGGGRLSIDEARSQGLLSSDFDTKSDESGR